MVRRCLRGSDERAERCLGSDLGGPPRPRGRPDRVRQDPVGLPVVDRPAGDRAGSGGEEAPLPRALRLPAQGARGRRRAQPASAPGRHPADRRAARRGGARGQGRRALRRHVPAGAAPDPDHASRHPDHHSRVAVPDAHLAGPRVAAGRGDGDHRRGARRRRHQARRPPGDLAGAARRAARQAGATDRTLRDRATGRRGRPVPRWIGARRGGGARLREGVGPQGRRAGGGHARARRGGRGRPHRVVVAARRVARARPDRAAQVDDRLRQLPPARRAADGTAQRARRRARRSRSDLGG